MNAEQRLEQVIYKERLKDIRGKPISKFTQEEKDLIIKNEKAAIEYFTSLGKNAPVIPAPESEINMVNSFQSTLLTITNENDTMIKPMNDFFYAVQQFNEFYDKQNDQQKILLKDALLVPYSTLDFYSVNSEINEFELICDEFKFAAEQVVKDFINLLTSSYQELLDLINKENYVTYEVSLNDLMLVTANTNNSTVEFQLNKQKHKKQFVESRIETVKKETEKCNKNIKVLNDQYDIYKKHMISLEQEVVYLKQQIDAVKKDREHSTKRV